VGPDGARQEDFIARRGREGVVRVGERDGLREGERVRVLLGEKEGETAGEKNMVIEGGEEGGKQRGGWTKPPSSHPCHCHVAVS